MSPGNRLDKNGAATRAAGNSRPRVVATFEYRSADGEVVYRVQRLEPGRDGRKKDFIQQRPDGNGGWVHGIADIPRVLYRLPELLDAPNDRWVFLTEGERKADVLAELGLVATSQQGGANAAWPPSFNDWLKGRPVVILPDNDEAGRKRSVAVAEAIAGVAAEVRVLDLPGLGPKGDVIDWLAAGGNKDALCQLVQECRAYEPLAVRAEHLKPAGETGYDIILSFFRRKYLPSHQSDKGVYSTALGRYVRPADACGAANKELIDLLAEATNAPRNKNNSVDTEAIPTRFFRTWAPPAFADMRDALPFEENAPEIVADAREKFRRQVAAVMYSELTLPVKVKDKDTKREVERMERRSLIHWAVMFAKPLKWADIRSRQVWCMKGRDGRARVAIRLGLFGQVQGAAELAAMSSKRFVALAKVYEVSTEDGVRVSTGDGQERAVELHPLFLAELMARPAGGGDEGREVHEG